MPLEKKIVVGKVEVRDLGVVHVDMEISVSEGNDAVTKSVHSFDIYPGEDYSKHPPKVQSVCLSAHTAQVIEAYKASLS